MKKLISYGLSNLCRCFDYCKCKTTRKTPSRVFFYSCDEMP